MKKISDSHMFRAFRSVDYRLYFAGRSVSQFGTWMQRTAVVWVVYSITHSAFLLGVTVFAEQFPSFLFSVMGGIVADRYDRYKVIQVTQIVSIIQAVLLAGLVVTGHMVIWAIIALSVVLGIINAFDIPARQSLIHEVVADPADLPNALALTTAMASLAQLLGPALSGIVLNTFGPAVCFLLNAASFGGVMISLMLMKRPAAKPPKPPKKVSTEFAEGFRYLAQTPSIGILIIMLTCVSLLVLPYSTVLPVFAKVIFSGDATTYGYITSFVGVGAVACTIFLASRKPGTPLRKILLWATAAMGIGLFGFSQIRNFPLAMCFAAVTGFGAMAQFTVCNIVAQSESAAHMRGRVISILLMAIVGIMPLGSLLVGAVSQHIGAPATVACEGVIAVIIALSFARFLNRPGKPAIPNDVILEQTEEIIAEHVAENV